MAKLIILAGYTGIGKTTIASQYTDQTLYLSGDDIHRDSARRAFPYIHKKDLYNWLSWPEDPRTMNLELLLFFSLQSVCPDIREHNGSILIEGTMLANSWYREPLVTALAANGHNFPRNDISLLYMRPPHDKVFKNIQTRLSTVKNRQHERKKLPNAETVARKLESYERFLADSPWLRFATSEEVHQAIQGILNSSPPPKQRGERGRSQSDKARGSMNNTKYTLNG